MDESDGTRAKVGILLSRAFDEELSLQVDPDISDELLSELSEAGIEADSALAHSDAPAKLLMYLLKPESLEVLARIISSVMQRHGNRKLKVNVSTGELEAIGYSGSEAAEFLRILLGEQDEAKAASPPHPDSTY